MGLYYKKKSKLMMCGKTCDHDRCNDHVDDRLLDEWLANQKRDLAGKVRQLLVQLLRKQVLRCILIDGCELFGSQADVTEKTGHAPRMWLMCASFVIRDIHTAQRMLAMRACKEAGGAVQADVFNPSSWQDLLPGSMGLITCLGAFGSNDFMLKVRNISRHFSRPPSPPPPPPSSCLLLILA